MGRQYWKPGNMLYPVPAVLVTSRDENGRANVMTAAWAGTLCSDPVMVYVSIRPERFSHDIIERTGEYAIALTTRKLLRATDLCGVKSGRDIDKWKAAGITQLPGRIIAAPGVVESPVNLECRVEEVKRLGSHDCFLARVVSVDVDDAILDPDGRLDLGRAGLITYSHGEYYTLGEKIGTFGWSVRKRK